MLKERISPPVCRKKNSGLGQGEWGLMRAMERGFRGVGCAIRLDSRFLSAKISQKITLQKITDCKVFRTRREGTAKFGNHPRTTLNPPQLANPLPTQPTPDPDFSPRLSLKQNDQMKPESYHVCAFSLPRRIRRML
jgi:hypothetical protein